MEINKREVVQKGQLPFCFVKNMKQYFPKNIDKTPVTDKTQKRQQRNCKTLKISIYFF